MKNRIFHLTFSQSGGTGKVANTLSKSLKDLNFESTFYSLQKN